MTVRAENTRVFCFIKDKTLGIFGSDIARERARTLTERTMTTDVLIRSPHIQVVHGDDGQAVIWNSLFGHPMAVNETAVEFLDSFTTPTTIAGDRLSEDEKNIIAELRRCYFLVPADLDERGVLAAEMQQREVAINSGSQIEFLELIMSESCNFRCTYCIHFNNLETSDRIKNPQKFMTVDRGREVIDSYLAILRKHGKTVATINFGGGEPLMVWGRIRDLMAYCVDQHGDEFELRFLLNTNASLITPAVASLLKGYGVQVATSLDGLANGNDRVRLTKSGRGTFNRIVRGFDNLDAAGYPVDGFAVTVTEANFGDLDESIIDWATSRGMSEVRIDIDVIDMVDIRLEDIVEKLMRIRRYANERGVDVPGFWARPAENLSMPTLEQAVAFCGAVRGNSMCVSPSGNIYGCGYSTTQLGTLSQIQSFTDRDSAYSRFVIDHQTGVMEMCKGCMIEGQCAGGCHITQEFAQSTQTAKTTRMCDFYRMMTAAILREQLREA